jgi:putative oxidoreductase
METVTFNHFYFGSNSNTPVLRPQRRAYGTHFLPGHKCWCITAVGPQPSTGATTMDTTRYASLVGRLLIGLPFAMSGFGKLAAYGATTAYIASAGLPVPPLAYAIAVLVELGGGLLLIAGYQARSVALALAVFSLAAAVSFHNNFADQNQMIHFLKNVMMAGGLLQIFAFGAGAISLDARLLRSGVPVARTAHAR